MSMREMDNLEGEVYHLRMLLMELARVAEASAFWIDKSTPDGQLAHLQLKAAIVKARKP